MLRRFFPLATALALSMLTGCLNGSVDNAQSIALGGVNGSGSAGFTLNLSGFAVYRLMGHDNVLSRYEGDSPQFCFQMPENTTRFEAHFTWDTPNQMTLAFSNSHNDSQTYADPREPPPTNATPPRHVQIDEPEPGEWVGSGVPYAVGGATNWRMHLTWNVARANASVDEVQYDNGKCFEE